MSVLRELLAEAVRLGASDIHLKFNQLPALRINGALTGFGQTRLSTEHLFEVAENLIPSYQTKKWEQEHEVDFALLEDGVGRFRVNIYMSQGAPCFTLRHVKSEVPRIDSLNLPPVLGNLALSQRGIILMAGTTGSGKSTTLAAMIDHINSRKRSRIITIEDPIEYQFKDKESLISQREVGLDTLTFHAALKYVLRQDPDVIMVGEMRDAESFSAALSAADTGHLVFSTVHADNASQAVTRILDFFPHEERDQMRIAIATNLRAIIGQRLVPGLQTGVVPAVEILINTPTVRKLIEKNKLDKLPLAIETGKEDGMQSFNLSVYQLIKSGMITEEDGMRTASNPETLTMNLKGIFLSEDRRILDTD